VLDAEQPATRHERERRRDERAEQVAREDERAARHLPPGAREDGSFNAAFRNPAGAVIAAKEAVNRAHELSLEAGLEFERRNFYLLFASQDQREGMDAFMEKRTPAWKGR